MFMEQHILVSYAKLLSLLALVRERLFFGGELSLLSVSSRLAAAMWKERASPCLESKLHCNDVQVSQKPAHIVKCTESPKARVLPRAQQT